jgi:hypothetical protein
LKVFFRKCRSQKLPDSLLFPDGDVNIGNVNQGDAQGLYTNSFGGTSSATPLAEWCRCIDTVAQSGSHLGSGEKIYEEFLSILLLSPLRMPSSILSIFCQCPPRQ